MNVSSLTAKEFRLSVLPPRDLLLTLTDTPLNVSLPGGAEEYEHRLATIQRLRGTAYVADGALPAAMLDSTGRHRCDRDYHNWHLYQLETTGAVGACFHLHQHHAGVDISQLRIFDVLRRMPAATRARFERATEAFLEGAARQNINVAEVGGWATSLHARKCRSTMVLPFSAWSLLQIIGHAMVLSAATMRHQSARILKSIGGFGLALDGLPMGSFHDSFYGCEMEIVAYDSRHPLPKYRPLVDRVTSQFLAFEMDRWNLPNVV